MNIMNDQISILVIDDQKTMLRVYTALLEQQEFNDIDQASSGEEAIRLMEKKTYDLILSDWDMPVISGLDLLKKMRNGEIQNHKNTPFVMISSEHGLPKQDMAVIAGANEYIAKPFNASTLNSKILSVLDKKPNDKNADLA